METMRWLGIAGAGVLNAVTTVESFNISPQHNKRLGKFRATAAPVRSTCCAPPPHPLPTHHEQHSLYHARSTARKRLRHTALSASTADQSSSTAGGRKANAYVDAVAPLERIDVSGLSPSQISEVVDLSRPCILTGALATPDCEAWCDALLEDLGDQTCAFQIRENKTGRSEVFEASLIDFVQGLQQESTHEDSWYLLEEDLLGLPQARPELGALLAKSQALLGVDEFDFFPASVRPQNLCTVIGGVGARSFLHSDPMEWMGWNVLLEGRKTWTFLPPLPEFDATLGTYRLAPNAFGSHNISAGWQSDIDLYQRGATPRPTPSTPTERADGTMCCASWPKEGEGQDIMQHAVSGVQEVGDLVLIPPRHWHQVYHLEPSVAVASQFMDHRVRHGVFRHILDWCGAAFCLDDLLLSSDFDALTPADQIREVLRAALVARHGPEKGLEVSASLG